MYKKALYANTKIKVATALPDGEARTMAREMGMEYEDITNMEPYAWAVSIKGMDSGIQKPKNISFTKWPPMSFEEQKAFREENRKRYAQMPDEKEQGKHDKKADADIDLGSGGPF